MRHALATLVLGLFCLVQPAGAKDRAIIIGLMADSAADLPMALRIATALDHQGGLRILPMAGKGPSQTLTDLVHLEGVDAALLPSDVLAYAVREKLLDVKPSKISYIVKLASRSLVLVARKDVDSLAGLAGKRIAVGTTADVSFVSARLLLDATHTSVDEAPLSGEAALTGLAEGSVDAAFLTADDAATLSARHKLRGVHILPLPLPDTLAEAFAPALLTADILPGLLKKSESVETVSSSLILAVFEWPKGSPQSLTTKAFAAALFDALGRGGGAGLNLAASVPGWTRARVAEELLASPATVQPVNAEN